MKYLVLITNTNGRVTTFLDLGQSLTYNIFQILLAFMLDEV